MSQFRHILVFSLIFATYQFTKSEDVSEPPEPSEPPETANFDFDRKNGSFIVKISMESVECVNDRVSTTSTTSTTSRPRPTLAGLLEPETGTSLLGTRKNPATSCSELSGSDTYYIKTSTDPIRVTCDDSAKTTCLIVKEKIEEESAISSTEITLGEQLWLSQTTFNMESLYNKVKGITGTNILQISHLLSTSVNVSQTIRYYYTEGNATTAEDANVKSLKALLWNDQSVGSEITEQMPFAFRVRKTEPCWEENTNGWVCTEIHFDATYTNRLPVRDFYIKDIRKSGKVQKIYFELVDLCFYYK